MVRVVCRRPGECEQHRVFHANVYAAWPGVECPTARKLATAGHSLDELVAYRAGLRPCFRCYPERRRYHR